MGPYRLRELKVELTNPRCGLCAYFPVEAGDYHHCEIREERRKRDMKPPRRSGKNLSLFICFHPMTELARERFNRIRMDKENKWRSIRRARNPEPYRERSKKWANENPDKVKIIKARYREKNRVWLRIKSKKYYEKNKVEINARKRERWRVNKT